MRLLFFVAQRVHGMGLWKNAEYFTLWHGISLSGDLTIQRVHGMGENDAARVKNFFKEKRKTYLHNSEIPRLSELVKILLKLK